MSQKFDTKNRYYYRFFSQLINSIMTDLLHQLCLLNRRIEIAAKQVLWNESGTLVCIATDENLFILKYDSEAEAKGL